MNKLTMALCVWTLALGCAVNAATIEKVDFPDEINVDGQKLVLNGGGLRKKKKFFKLWDVYVGALYLPAKSTDAKAILASPAPKVIEMVYVRSIDKETLQEGWEESFKKGCGADCDAIKDQLKAFNDTMVDVKDRSRLRLTFKKSSVDIDLKGKENKTAMIEGEAFRRILLDMFLGENTAAPELKPKLLGQ